MKKLETKITRYQYGMYFVDIVETKVEFAAWLHEQGTGLAILMFGALKEQKHMDPPRTITLSEFVEDVEAVIEDYIETYEQKQTAIEAAEYADLF